MIKYLTILEIYISSRILIIINPQNKKKLCNGLIIAGIISIIIGIDNLTFGLFNSTYEWLGAQKNRNLERRMIGNFGYANSFAISITIPLLIILDRYINLEEINKKYCLYIGLMFILVTGIMLSYSRLVLLALILILVIYVALLKKMDKNIKLINLMTELFILSFLYIQIFSKITNYFISIAVLVAFTGITIPLTIAINKAFNKVTLKEYLIFILSTIILGLVIVTIGLKLEKPLVLFQEGNFEVESVEYYLKPLKPSNSYTLDFSIDSKANNADYLYEIIIDERNKLDRTVKVHKIEFGTFSGNKVMQFNTSEIADHVYIIIRSLDVNKQQGLTINNFKINGKSYALNYLYFPYRLINRFQAMNLSLIFNQGRSLIYKTAMELISRNPITGIGGEGWKYTYNELVKGFYITKQVHSYPLQIWLEYGILAIIAYFIITICIFNKLRNVKREDYAILMSILIIWLHGMVDFDLSFLSLLIYTYMLINIISTKKY